MTEDERRTLFSDFLDSYVTSDVRDREENVWKLAKLIAGSGKSEVVGLNRSICSKELDLKLQAHCYFEAAHLFVGPEMRYAIERVRDGMTIARIFIPHSDNDIVVTGSDAGDALMGALGFALWEAEGTA